MVASNDEVLEATPSSSLQIKDTPLQKKQKSGKVMQSVQRQLKLQYDERDCDFIMQNRMGWEKFNTIQLQHSDETTQ